MPHYVVDAVHKTDGELGILIIYAPDLGRAKELTHEKARFTYDVEGELTQRRPTPGEFRSAIVVADKMWFAGFGEEEREWLFGGRE